ncbi:hypothetical protein N9211_02020 [Pseudomonadales bacterium]|nr:hypothetical protein [Pseudomonadales bacterium]
MKSLADFIMRSPLHGALVAALATASLFLAWIGAAAVALMVLRHGVNRAAIVFLAALVPAAFWMFAGDIGPLTTLVCAVILAAALRVSQSWSVALLATPFVIGTWCMLIVLLAPEYVETIRLIFEQVLQGFKARVMSSASDTEREVLDRINAPSGMQIMGMLAILQALTTIFSLLVGRWWQALLYNPGGFQQEFHALKLDRLHGLVLVGGFIVVASQDSYSTWSWMFIVPLLVAGMALVHGLVAKSKLPVRWLVLFYMALFVFRPLVALLAAVAVADSALDFRSRVGQKNRD